MPNESRTTFGDGPRVAPGIAEAPGAVDEPHPPVGVDQEIAEIAVPVGDEVVEDTHQQVLLMPASVVRGFNLELSRPFLFGDRLFEPDSDGARFAADRADGRGRHAVHSQQPVELVSGGVESVAVEPVE